MESLTTQTEIMNLLVAGLLGAFLGVRREVAALESKKNQSFMGFRTMVLISIMGAVSTFFPALPWLPAVCFAGLLTLLGITYANGAINLKRIGITSEVSAMLMFLIGVLAGYESYMIAMVITVVLGYLNAFKSDIKAFFKTMTIHEWKGALQLLLLSAMVFPFLPREAIDPWGVFVPFTVWMMVIMISGIGLVGYFLIKYFGARGGVPLTALLGATVSSTAVTSSIASQSKRLNINNIFASGLLLALGTMQFKVAAVIWVLGIADIKISALIPLAMGFTSYLLAGYFWWKSTHKSDEQKVADRGIKSHLSQPFELKPALFFGFLFVVVIALVALGKHWFGSWGVYGAAILSAAVDIDAIVLSSLQSVKMTELSLDIAINAIGLALVANTLIKLLYLLLYRSTKLFWKVLVPICISSGVGVAVMFLI